MFCKKCGKEMKKDAKFCPNCGAQTSTGSQVEESQEPVFALRPVFVAWVTMLSLVPVQIFFSIWATLFLGVFGMFAVQGLKLGLPDWFTFVLFGCLSFFGFPIITYLAKKKSYEKTEYRFYNTKLEYYEGFFTIEEKTISYKNITEVYLKKSIFQRKCGLGTLILSTPATGDEGSGRARSGIRVADITNPDDVYKQVKELVRRVS